MVPSPTAVAVVAMLANPAVQEHIQRAAALATSFQPILYWVAFVDERADAPNL